MLTAKLRDLGIEFVELLDEFAVAAASTTLYKPLDTHWNIAGNKLAAETMQKDLFEGSAKPAMISSTVPANAESLNYEGFHEATDCNSIKGWSWNVRHPNDPIRIALYDGDTLIGTVSANLFRKDLLDAGKGNGAHAFEFAIPRVLKDGRPHEIRAKIADTGIWLTGTPKSFRCSTE
jgi:hypothetical protein